VLSDVRAILHQDPFTGRAYRKPRGYAGDGVLLDLMYRSAPLPDETTTVGRAVYGVSSTSPASVSVRARRDLLSAYIDRAAALTERASVLSVAAGHLREGQRCRALARGSIGRFVALDQDPAALGVVEAEQSHFGVEVRLASVRQLIAGSLELDRFDVIYTAGLYDYLEKPAAIALTRVLFDALEVGGRLLIANFTPDLIDIGYMEAIMDWWLLFRDEADMDELASRIPADAIAAKRIWRDELRNVIYIELQRA
jgi:SAM-dependent methyltransferase